VFQTPAEDHDREHRELKVVASTNASHDEACKRFHHGLDALSRIQRSPPVLERNFITSLKKCTVQFIYLRSTSYYAEEKGVSRRPLPII
jgi:hypothetical protein